jgi:hypothetical protein
MRQLDELIIKVSEIFGKVRIPYMFVGAVSVNYWGLPRTTSDIDVIISIKNKNKNERIEKLVREFRKENFDCSSYEIVEALKEKSHFTVHDKLSPYRVDVKGIYTDFDKESFSRRKRRKILGRNLWINSPEDLILAKLLFGREQDLADARGIILRQRDNLEVSYLKKRSQRMGTYQKLAELMEAE